MKTNTAKIRASDKRKTGNGPFFTLRGTIVFLFLLVQAVIASSPLLRDGWFLSHDAVFHLNRIAAVMHEMDAGNYYPRWLSAGAYGKGLPVLNYYSPGIYLVLGYLHLLGFSLLLSLKFMCSSLFLLGTSGMFLWVKRHCGLFGALIAATIYTFVPYHFVDIYVRGALPEFAAIALLPFLFYGIDLSFSEERGFSGIVLTGVTTALVILTHNLTAFMILPFAFLYFIGCAYSAKSPFRKIVAAACGPLLGVGLSAFYWLPTLTEIGYLAHFKESILSYSYSQYFIHPSDWLSPRWGFGPALPRGNNTMSFQIGYVLSVFVIIAISTILTKPKERGFGLITLTLGMLALFLTISPSAEIYKRVSVMQYVQFPWRYLGIATLFFAAFAGLAVNWICVNRFSRGRAIMLCIAFGCSVLLSQSHRKVQDRLSVDLDQKAQSIIANKEISSMSFSDEYLPKWSNDSVAKLKFDLILLPPFSPLKVRNLETRGSEMWFRAESVRKADLTVSQFYFPGWRATLDGDYWPVGYSAEGFITLTIPPGEHAVHLWFGTTAPRVTGWLIAAVTLLILLFGGYRKRQGRFRGAANHI